MDNDNNKRRSARLVGIPRTGTMSALLALSSISGGGVLGSLINKHRAREITESLCLNCKTPYRHNNSFCSAACCKEYDKR